MKTSLYSLAIGCFIALTILVSRVAAANTVSIVHYNVRELDSTKLAAGLNSDQVRKAVEVSKKFSWHLLSMNEMQFDLPGVPNAAFSSEGMNLQAWTRLLVGEKASHFSYAFGQANTGNLAKKKSDGTYEVDTQAANVMELADKVNFGIFPGQYSSGGVSRFPIESTTIIAKLPWKSFNKNLDLNQYRDSDGNEFPENKQLFDKNFTDAVVNINGKRVHYILLHTVPAHHFGNPKSPNNERNHDQLAFLEWYLSGSSSVFNGDEIRWKDEDENDRVIRPLAKDAIFVAVGDWNVDIRDESKPGSNVLKNLYKKFKPWKELDGDYYTYESSSFRPAGWKAQLDYILFSNNVEVVEGGIYSPAAGRKELGCGAGAMLPKSLRKGRVTRSYTKKENEVTLKCWVEVNEDYALSKEASDHKLLWAKFKL